MKPSFFLAIAITLMSSSCQNFHLPFGRNATAAAPAYGAANQYGANTGNYQAYPGTAAPVAGQNYNYPNFTPTGEQANVSPANGNAPALAQNYPAQQDWSPSNTAAQPAPKTTTPKTTAPKAAARTASAPVGGGGSYMVKSGDTLYGIAKSKGTTVTKLMQLNGLKSTNIGKGMTLRMP
jgi:hypothetical protein